MNNQNCFIRKIKRLSDQEFMLKISGKSAFYSAHYIPLFLLDIIKEDAKFETISRPLSSIFEANKAAVYLHLPKSIHVII